MKRLKAIVLVITLITGILGVVVTDTNRNHTNLETEEYAAYNTESVTELPTPTDTPLPTPVFLESEVLALSSDEKQPSDINGTAETGHIDEIEIPEVVVAEVNDTEDPEPNKTKSQGTVTIQKEEVLLPTPTAISESNETETKEEYTKTVKIGIDVSKWNGVIDWKKVADSGVEFAMIRTGYRGNTYGNIVADPYFEQNIKGALANGIEVGVYFYSQAVNEEEARQEAAWVCKLISDYNITYPVAYDLEEVGTNRIKNVSYSQLNKNARAFLDYVNAKGYTGSMYGCKSYLETVWNMSLFSDCHVWLAHYTSKTTYTGRYDMWQYTESGKVNGISTSVDLNYAYFYVKNEGTGSSDITSAPTLTPVPQEEGTPTPEITEAATFTEADDQCVVVVSDGTLNVREGSGTDYAVIGTLENGAVVRRTGVGSNGWSEIEYNGGKAFVSSKYLEVVAEAELSLTPAAALNETSASGEQPAVTPNETSAPGEESALTPVPDVTQ